MPTELSSQHQVNVTYRAVGGFEMTEIRPLRRHELAEFDERFGRRNLPCLQEMRVDEDGVITYWWFDPPADMDGWATYADGSQKIISYRVLCLGGRLEQPLAEGE